MERVQDLQATVYMRTGEITRRRVVGEKAFVYRKKKQSSYVLYSS